MTKMMAWWAAHRPSNRRLMQLYAALLYNANLKGFVKGELFTGSTKALCVPGLNCYSCPGAVMACPLGALQNALASSGHVAGWYIFGILLLFGITLGRTVCGWLCPVGLIGELLYKIPSPKIRKNAFTRILSYLKYVVLAVFAVALPLYYGLVHKLPYPAFCKYICPAGTLEGAMALLANEGNTSMFSMLGEFFTRKFGILIIIALASVFFYRAFCRFLCPLGALYSLFNRFAVVGVALDEDRCSHCGACVRHCGMDVRKVGDHECISCGKCMHVCPEGAIRLEAGGVTLKGPERGKHALPEAAVRRRKRGGRLLWGCLLALLVSALLYFNLFDVTKETMAGESTAASVSAAGGAESAAAAAESVSAAGGAENAAAAAESVAIAGGAENAAAAAESVSAAGGAESAAAAADYTSTAPIGPEVGQQLEDFSCDLVGGGRFRLSEQRGKIVFINQWATYCTPCCNELPEFERLREEHPEIVILAVHNTLEVKPTAAQYIEEKGWSDWALLFTVDTDGEIIPKIKGDNTMPRTVVLNRKGEVVYNEQKSLTYEMLSALLEKAEAAS